MKEVLAFLSTPWVYSIIILAILPGCGWLIVQILRHPSISDIVGDLKKREVILGGNKHNIASLLYSFENEFAHGVIDWDIRGGMQVKFAETDGSILQKAYQEFVVVLSSKRIIKNEPRIESSGPHTYTAQVFILTDIGWRVLDSIRSKIEKSTAHKGDSQT